MSVESKQRAAREDSSDDLTVRVAEAGDGDAFVRFNCAMALETENKRLDESIVGPGVKAVFVDPSRGFYVLAESASRIVAALMVTFEWSDWRNANFWWIQSVYVTPEFRRRGVYSRLYDFVRDRARADGGVCGFRLYVEKDNTAAQDVYESLGMSASGYLMYEEAIER
jgi:ribosomal protein S18 acetylase RimI-like enzyme